MNKRKLINFDDYRDNIKPNTQLGFGSASPFEQVATPKALFVTTAGNLSPVSGTSIAVGTMEVCRPGEKDPARFNFDRHVFYSTGTPSLLELVEIESGKIPYHWTNSYPSHIKKTAPKWVRDIENS